ncbi:YgaP family membrane protein [Thiosocius teredinicola]|uniref:YgaP family membrane protein n=1 Tax=Thiosocius teredinicola TaxID=1973002 RepID=UPI000990B534
MSKNVGTVDRAIRAIAGIAIIAWGYVEQNWLGAIGLVPLFTAAIGWCPAYVPFGIKTNKS